MRAIAVPKYSSKIIASSNFRPVDNGEKLYLNAITAFKSITVDVGEAITFYVDYLNTPTEIGGV